MIKRDRLEKQINKISKQLINIRRYLHQNAEVGFELYNTLTYVENELLKNGLNPIRCGKCGLYVDIGNGNNYLLLRADMDALPIYEDTNLSYKCCNGNMHACGHDLHTTMLIGAALILKKYEDKLFNKIRLVFQPAEEILSGAKDMIDGGVLDNINVVGAMMIHNLVNTERKTGEIYIPRSGIISTSVDYVKIKITGKSSHSAMPELSNDSINVSSLIIQSIQQIASKEISIKDQLIISFGEINAGNSYNVIPSECNLKLTVRAFDKKIREFAIERIKKICNNIARAFNCQSKIEIVQSCPSLIIDENIKNATNQLFNKEFKNELILDDNFINGAGSEDFAYFSNVIPSIMINVMSGNKIDGYKYPLHNEKVIFDEKVIQSGTLLYAYFALNIYQYLK